MALVMDNLNTHGTGSLYGAFNAETARSLTARLEIHHTPNHGSWLPHKESTAAETELSILYRRCLDRRIDGQQNRTQETAAWERKRNCSESIIDWQFTIGDARIKLKRLSPTN